MSSSFGLLAKRALGFIYAPLSMLQPARRVILIYHAIGDSQWAVSKENFKRQIDWLNENTQLVSLSELLRNSDSHDLQVAITFDDGYECVYEFGFPILQQYKIPATVYLNTGWITENENKASDPEQGHYASEKFMNWQQVQALSENGWNIGSHGVEHFDLTNKDTSIIKTELSESKKDIELKLDKSCDDFSYTWGHYNESLSDLVCDSGYLTSVAGVHGPVTPTSNKFALPRIDIRREYRLDDFAAVVSGRWDYLKYVQKLRS